MTSAFKEEREAVKKADEVKVSYVNLPNQSVSKCGQRRSQSYANGRGRPISNPSKAEDQRRKAFAATDLA